MNNFVSYFEKLPAVASSSFWLMLVAGGLLILAGVLLIFRRTSKVEVERSLMTDEMMIYLSRIAEALERQSERPTVQQVLESIQNRGGKRTEEETKLTPQSHVIPYSMFGREFREGK